MCVVTERGWLLRSRGSGLGHYLSLPAWERQSCTMQATPERDAMAEKNLQPNPSHDIPEHYQLRIQGHLMPCWSETFEGMQLTLTKNGETLIRGPVADQAALHGLLARIRDLNLTLISVTRVQPERHSNPTARRSGK
jgi:hypothetical protein